MRKVFIVVSTLVILATIIGCGFLVYDSLTYESDDDIFGNSLNFIWVPMAVFILLFEFTISHGILYFTSFEWKTKLKDILNGIAMAIVVYIPTLGFLIPELTAVSFIALILIRIVYFVVVIVERSRALINKIRQRKNTENSQVNA